MLADFKFLHNNVRLEEAIENALKVEVGYNVNSNIKIAFLRY